jgi:hypothetical protein
MNEDTEGFYKIDSTSGEVLCGPNFVYGPYDQYRLFRNEKDTYTYPIDGWYWFDTEQEAYDFFGVEWYPEVYTIGLLKPWLNETNNIENG